jgi:hypothetical protein
MKTRRKAARRATRARRTAGDDEARLLGVVIDPSDMDVRIYYTLGGDSMAGKHRGIDNKEAGLPADWPPPGEPPVELLYAFIAPHSALLIALVNALRSLDTHGVLQPDESEELASCTLALRDAMRVFLINYHARVGDAYAVDPVKEGL